ncbi:hypothetical protein HanOQP8_Chr08g0285531 [Helianthus annuus]|nr:hypothetical protein HanOQP8_Chr08g0285531 [Helianthus annuus]
MVLKTTSKPSSGQQELKNGPTSDVASCSYEPLKGLHAYGLMTLLNKAFRPLTILAKVSHNNMTMKVSESSPKGTRRKV